MSLSLSLSPFLPFLSLVFPSLPPSFSLSPFYTNPLNAYTCNNTHSLSSVLAHTCTYMYTDNYIDIVTSSDPSQRGAQLSLMFSCPVDKVSTAIQAKGAAVSALTLPFIKLFCKIAKLGCYMSTGTDFCLVVRSHNRYTFRYGLFCLGVLIQCRCVYMYYYYECVCVGTIYMYRFNVCVW